MFEVGRSSKMYTLSLYLLAENVNESNFWPLWVSWSPIERFCWPIQLNVSVYVTLSVSVCLCVCVSLCVTTPLTPLSHRQWVTAETEIKIPSVENTEPTNVLPVKSGLGQNIAMHASPTARKFFLVLISAIPVHWPSFFPSPLLLNPTHLFIHVDPWNKSSHLVHSHKRVKQVPVVWAFRI